MEFRNAQQDRAFSFIEQSDFDIFCLQEVPEEFLKRLQTLPYFISFHVDEELSSAIPVQNIYVAILSRYPIAATGGIAFPDYWPLLPWYSRLFIRLLRPFHIFKARNHGGMYCDILADGRLLRVFSLHLKMLAKPAWRIAEFETAMAKCDPALPTVVCGDFNTFEKPHITPLNWLNGGSIADVLLYRRERTLLEKRFFAYEFTNALRGKMTHPLSWSQLDHILVPNSFSIKNAGVIGDRFGSDHHLIFVEAA
jgi:endonuclease/exonuclease/phosphatase family metal-dependent hydrolase